MKTLRALILAAGAVAVLMLAACGNQSRSSSSVATAVSAQEGQRSFQEMVRAMDNTLLEINELERMGGGIRDRIVLIDAQSLVTDDNRLHYIEAVDRDAGRITTLRASLQTNEAIQEALTRSGHRLGYVVAVDAKPQGAVIVYYDPKMAY